MVIFPVFPGLGWSVTKVPKFANRKQRSLAGRVLFILDQPLPTWTFTLTLNFLRDINDNRIAPAWSFDELRSMMGFFLTQQGSFGSFLFDDPTDDIVANQYIGTGNGSTTKFQLVRTMPNLFNEPIIAPNTVSHVYQNAVPVGGWSVDANTGIVTFGSPPANGVIVTADFSYYFRVHFVDDMMNFENFMVNLWSVKEVKFESILL